MNELYGSIFFLVISITLLSGEVSIRRFISRAKKTRGTIIELETKSDGFGIQTIALVEYITEKDRIYRYRSETGAGFFKRVGDPVTVYYDPKRPDEKVMIPNETLWSIRIVGLLTLGFSLYTLVQYLK